MIKLLSTILRQSAWLACLLLSLQAYADGVSIDRASGRTKDNVYLMDAAINYELSDSVLEAVNHGIQLYFDVTIEVRQEHKWLWDDVLKTVTLGYLLQYRPLSSDYLVTNIANGDVETLQDLDEALRYLGTITDYPLIDQSEIKAEGSYRCFIMSELRINTLPLPLQPLAYISPKRHLTSQWYEWIIR